MGSSSSLYLFFFLICIGVLLANSQPPSSDPIQDLVCKLVNCGQGTCKISVGTLLPFDCECYEGWKKIQIGPLTFPSCLVPNCTVDLSCGGGTPPPPPPPPASLPPPPANLSDPCSLTWCGDGVCVIDGSGYLCQCNEGSANLLDMKGLACFKECAFGADCGGLGFGPHTPPPPPSPVKNGPSEEPNSSGTQYALTILLVVAIFLSLI